jgi:myo-inositol-1(or 4)-monophosphatase
VSTPAAGELLSLARDTAAEAAEFLRTGRDGMVDDVDTKSSPTDIVTAMDKAAEARIVERLLAARPDDGLLGEEGAGRPGTSGVRWVIDPIDGTVNYLYRLPQWAVSIAAEVDGVIEAGVVFDPSRDELFTAVRGEGAFLNGRPISVTGCSTLAQALVGTGFGYDTARRARQAVALTQILPVIRDIRRLGAASLDLCWVACGRLDAYFERGLNYWDHAAGALVAAEAGGRVEGLHGRELSDSMVIAAPPALFDALHDLVAAVGADQV